VIELLGQMIGSATSEVWTDDAVISHERWVQVRNAAEHAIKEMGWRVPVA
jgi:hypothetical protein